MPTSTATSAASRMIPISADIRSNRIGCVGYAQLVVGGTQNDDPRDDRFRTGFQIGCAVGREIGFGEGVESMRRAVELMLRARDASQDDGGSTEDKSTT